MRAWLQRTLLGVLVFGASWTGSVSYWRSTNRMPSSTDLMVWMLALPLGLLAAFWIGRRVVAARSAPADATASAETPVVAPPRVPAPALALVATAVRNRHASSGEALAAAIDEQRARAELDPELTDENGYPVMSARIDEPGDAALREEFEAWRLLRGLADPGYSPEQWRALALGSAVAADLAGQAAAHPHAMLHDDAPAPPLLRIISLAPQDWSAPQREAAAGWLAHTAAQFGWPADRVLAQAAQESQAAELLARLSAPRAQGESLIAIVVAFDSHIGEAAIEQLAHAHRLFTPNRPQGLIPGEGAAALLLADEAHAHLIDETAFAPFLHPATLARDAAGDSVRRPDTAELSRAVEAALGDGALDAQAVAAVVADTSHRSKGLIELMSFAARELPHLDTAGDVATLGAACGHCGAVPFITALALARHAAKERGAPVLCLANEASHYRSAVLVRPPASQS